MHRCYFDARAALFDPVRNYTVTNDDNDDDDDDDDDDGDDDTAGYYGIPRTPSHHQQNNL